MIEITHTVAGREASIRVLENGDDLDELTGWLEEHDGEALAVDTETTGLDIFSDNFRIRTIQIGHNLEAWVIPVEKFEWGHHDVQWLLSGRPIVFQNATYDVLAIRRYYGLELDWEYIRDTKILAHLADPRAVREGGTGHSLEELTRAYIDPEVADSVKGSMSRLAKETGLKRSELFREIDLYHPTYLLYAGMDVILTYGLWNVLRRKLAGMKDFNTTLIKREHEIARVCAEMEWNGLRVDTRYGERLLDKLAEEREVWEALALLEYGVESVNSNEEVADAIEEAGFTLTERTPAGKRKVDKAILEDLSSQGLLLADYVLAAKSAGKKAKAWVSKFLDEADSNDKVHASINPLAARTARMSVSGVPAQQLPSSDWEIRRCFIPDDGNSMVSCDYQAQELRVLAALSGDENMQAAFREGADLHQLTADASGVARKVGKTVNFAYVYGSGAGNIAKTCGITVPKAKQVIQGFERTYPGVKKLSDKLQAQVKKEGRVVTPSGRVLPVDPERPYSCLNYLIQSTSRDITAAALLRLDEAGYTPYLRLPIHDEILFEAPADKAEQASRMVAGIMESVFQGVTIEADAEVYGASWGGGYVGDDEQAYLATF